MGFGRPAEVDQTQREYLVEAERVELSSMLTARKLLILGTATTAKKAPLPDSLYGLLYENALALEFCRHDTLATVSHRFVEPDREKHPASCDTASHRLATFEAAPAYPSRNFRLAGNPPKIDAKCEISSYADLSFLILSGYALVLTC